jgi:starch phosphorylase
LGAIPPEHVRVELFAEIEEGAPFVVEMNPAAELVGIKGGFVYQAKAPGSRPAGDYTVRIVAALYTLAAPLEEPLILWQR